MLGLAQKKHRPPFSVSKLFKLISFSKSQQHLLLPDMLTIRNKACTGAEVEMITPGGEVAFVQRMIDESVVLKEEVQWYTSMLGKYDSVATIIERLKEIGIKNWAVTEFVQGTKTRRWAVAWSWRDLRPRMVSLPTMLFLP